MNKFLLSIACCVAIYASENIDYPNMVNLLKKSYQIINLPQAYSQNSQIRGQDVTVGIVDSVFYKEHPSLLGKDKEIVGANIDRNDGTTNAKRIISRHGTHVAGIILGEYTDDNTPYGIANKAQYYGVGFFDANAHEKGVNLYDYFADKDVKIINNSWSNNNNANGRDTYINKIKTQAVQDIDVDTANLMGLAREKKVLQVFSAGNEGKNVPNFPAAAPSYDESLRA